MDIAQSAGRIDSGRELWINQGDLTFVDSAGAAGLDARPGFPMAITSADCDVDGDLDLFATGMGPDNPFAPGLPGEQVLFVNEGDGTYSDATYDSGLGDWEWGWGASFGDFDNDGDEDLATVGSVASTIMQFLGDLAGPGRVFENGGACDFQAVLDFGLENESTSGLAIADYDADGFTDMVIVRNTFDLLSPDGTPLSGEGSPVLLHNLGNDNRAITLRLVGSDSNAMAIGARVRAFTPDGLQIREVVAGSSFASTNSPWLHFGLGQRDRAVLVVEWPSGRDELFFVTARRGAQIVEEEAGLPL